MDHADKLFQHLFGHREIGDYAIFHRADSLDIAGNLSEHLFRFLAHRLNAFLGTGMPVVPDRDDRRFIQNNACIPDIDQRVGRPQIDGQII